MIDNDGIKYPTVKIGNQLWTKDNLVSGKFRNGDLIYQWNEELWNNTIIKPKLPALCFYDFDQNFGIENNWKFGVLYNYYAIIDTRGLAPEGWRIPLESDWIQLFDFIANRNSNDTGTKSYYEKLENINENRILVGQEVGQKLKSEEFPKGTNESGFTALPCGKANYDPDGMLATFEGLGSTTEWWSATEIIDGNFLQQDSAITFGIDSYNDYVKKSWQYKMNCISVRCVKDI